MLVKEKVEVSGHWYTAKGEPAYQIEGANGKVRNTTLRDAKKLGLYPSVTTITGVAAKAGLDAWKQQQAVLSALTLPRQDGEAEEDWILRVLTDAKETAKKAAERGNQIHAIIESYFDQVYLPEKPIYIDEINKVLRDAFRTDKWVSERSFCNEEMGYGGRVDLHAPKGLNFDGVVVDFKTTEKDLEKVEPFHEHEMQLAAYRFGLGIPKARCAIVFVNALTNKVKLCEIPPSDLTAGWVCFAHLLGFYRAKSGL